MNEVMPSLFAERALDEILKTNKEGNQLYAKGVEIQTAEKGYAYAGWKCMHYVHACAHNTGVDNPVQSDLPGLNPGNLFRPSDLPRYATKLEETGIIDRLYFESADSQMTETDINRAIFNLKKAGGVQIMIYSASEADPHGHAMIIVGTVATELSRTIERSPGGRSYVIEEKRYVRLKVIEAGANVGSAERSVDVFDAADPKQNRDVLVYKLSRLDRQRLIEIYNSDEEYRAQFDNYLRQALERQAAPRESFPSESLTFDGSRVRATHR